MLEFFALAKNNENFYPNKNFHGLILSIVVQTILKKIKTKCPSIFFNFIAVNFSSQRKINSAPSKRSVTTTVKADNGVCRRLERGGHALA